MSAGKRVNTTPPADSSSDDDVDSWDLVQLRQAVFGPPTKSKRRRIPTEKALDLLEEGQAKRQKLISAQQEKERKQEKKQREATRSEKMKRKQVTLEQQERSMKRNELLRQLANLDQAQDDPSAIDVACSDASTTTAPTPKSKRVAKRVLAQTLYVHSLPCYELTLRFRLTSKTRRERLLHPAVHSASLVIGLLNVYD